MHSLRHLSTAALVLLLASACADDQTSGPDAGLPTTETGGEAATGETAILSSGEATIQSNEGSETLTLNPKGYAFGKGAFTGSWTKLGSGEFLSVTSGEGTGTFPTSATTTLGVRLSLGAVGETVRIDSSDGSCTVTVNRADASGVDGSFECPSEGISGTFSAD